MLTHSKVIFWCNPLPPHPLLGFSMLTLALCKIKKLSQRQSSILQKLLGALHIQLAVQHWTEQKERDSMYVVYYILDVLWGQPIKLIQVVSTSEFHEYWWNNGNLNFWSKFFILSFWSSQCLRLLRPCRNPRGQKNKNIVPLIFMKFWSRNNLEELDRLTAQDV